MAPLTSIADRLTPSVPMELTFGQSPIATGRKITTLFGHMASSPGSGVPYNAYSVVNVGDPVEAKAEVDALAGANSQIGKMAYAFVNSNTLGGFGNFPQFRVVLIPNNRSDFGPNQEAITAVKFLRSDMFVSCYPASDSANESILEDLCILVSGIDRDLSGQFGSFMCLGSIESLAAQEAYNYNSRYVLVAALPDSNTKLVHVTGSTTSGSPIIGSIASATLSPTGTVTSGSSIITSVSSTEGVYVGASITAVGIPSSTFVEAVTSSTITMSANATATNAGESLTVVNVPATAGIYPGAAISGTGIPANATVISLNANSITISANATATGSSVSLSVQNQVSQAAEIVASAHAAGMMGSVFPYVPMNGVVAGGLIAPQKSSDWIEINPNGDSEAALSAGLSPLVVQPAGSVAFLRTRTTYVLNGSTPATAYFDWQDLVVMNDFRESMYVITQNPPFNNNPGGSKASLTIANLLLDEMIREAQFFEDQGAFQGVQTLAPLFEVLPSTTSRGRFDFYIPINVLPGLMVIAGNIQGVSNIGNFTL